MPTLIDLFPVYAQPIKFPINVPILYRHLNSTHEGTSGNDFILGSDGVDIMYGNGGLDYIAGRGGNDKLYAGSNTGTYKVDGSNGTWYPGGNSTALGGDEGHDTLTVLKGAKGAFYLDGGIGNDTLVANGGSEVRMHGGAGDTDTFRIGANFKGRAFIDDFNILAGDTLDLAHGTGSIAAIWMNAGNTEINLTSGGHVTVQGSDYTQHNANWGGHLI